MFQLKPKSDLRCPKSIFKMATLAGNLGFNDALKVNSKLNRICPTVRAKQNKQSFIDKCMETPIAPAEFKCRRLHVFVEIVISYY